MEGDYLFYICAVFVLAVIGFMYWLERTEQELDKKYAGNNNEGFESPPYDGPRIGGRGMM